MKTNSNRAGGGALLGRMLRETERNFNRMSYRRVIQRVAGEIKARRTESPRPGQRGEGNVA